MPNEKTAKRVDAHLGKVLKRLGDESALNENLVAVVNEVIWKIFGFPEAAIVHRKSSSFGSHRFDLYSGDAVQYPVFLYPSDSTISHELDEADSLLLSASMYRFLCFTNGKNYVLFEASSEPPTNYQVISELDFLNECEVSDSTLVSRVERFSLESHNLESLVDRYNRKRWWLIKSSAADEQQLKVLFNFRMNEDLSECVHVPWLERTYWSNEPLLARKNAASDVLEKVRSYRSLDEEDALSIAETLASVSEGRPILESGIKSSAA